MYDRLSYIAGSSGREQCLATRQEGANRFFRSLQRKIGGYPTVQQYLTVVGNRVTEYQKTLVGRRPFFPFSAALL